MIREYLTYKLANLVDAVFVPRASGARRPTWTARSKKPFSTHNALFLEHENDVARRLSGRDVGLPQLAFKALDPDALTTMSMLEYMLGNTDYSIWALHNVVIVQNKMRRLFPVPYDFDRLRDGQPAVCGARYAAARCEETDRSVVSRPVPYRRGVPRGGRTVPRAQGRHVCGDRVGQGIERVAQNDMKTVPRKLLPRHRRRRSRSRRTFVDGCHATRTRV